MSTTQTFSLQHPGSCTGMFWRKDPRPGQAGGAQRGGDNWPRNKSVLTGVVHEITPGDEQSKHLQVTEWTQAGESKATTDCAGLWMPFYQGGLLLHATK